MFSVGLEKQHRAAMSYVHLLLKDGPLTKWLLPTRQVMKYV